MQIFTLPASTIVGRVIPKNSFDKFTTSRQKKLFTEAVDKIRWENKLSLQTINLPGKDVTEIQIFEIALKKKTDIQDLLNIIDRLIPYNIVFIVTHNNKNMLAASDKHIHPTNEDSAVINWTFTTEWFDDNHSKYKLNLQQNLDYVWIDFCKQLINRKSEKLTLKELIQKEQKTKELKVVANSTKKLK